MRVIKYIVEHCEEELEDAEGYIDAALEYKDEHRSLADTLCKLAEQEVSHYMMLHEQAVALITQHRQKAGEPPEAMKAIWDWEHKKAMEDLAIVKVKINTYKGTN